MKKLFEEYGSVILVVVTTVLLLLGLPIYAASVNDVTADITNNITTKEYKPENNKDIRTLAIDGNLYDYENGMSWNEWISSSYNTASFSTYTNPCDNEDYLGSYDFNNDSGSFTITYNLTGGLDNSKNPTSYHYGEEINLLAPVPDSDIEHFSGWYTNEYFLGTPIKVIHASDAGNYNLYARVSDVSHTITFVNGGESSSSSHTPIVASDIQGWTSQGTIDQVNAIATINGYYNDSDGKDDDNLNKGTGISFYTNKGYVESITFEYDGKEIFVLDGDYTDIALDYRSKIVGTFYIYENGAISNVNNGDAIIKIYLNGVYNYYSLRFFQLYHDMKITAKYKTFNVNINDNLNLIERFAVDVKTPNTVVTKTGFTIPSEDIYDDENKNVRLVILPKSNVNGIQISDGYTTETYDKGSGDKLVRFQNGGKVKIAYTNNRFYLRFYEIAHNLTIKPY